MTRKLLRNLYWESVLDDLIEKEKNVLKLKTKSILLRILLKQRYGLCLDDECSAYANSNGFCQVHSSLESNADELKYPYNLND